MFRFLVQNSFAAENVIFASGFMADNIPYEILLKVKKKFADKGFNLTVSDTGRSGAVEKRASILAEEIEEKIPKGPFHIIAHSMGGLDSRYLISKMGFEKRVKSLTTIATPHLGTAVADLVIEKIDQKTGLTQDEKGILNLFKDDVDAIRALTTKSAKIFNQDVTDSKKVKYFSLAFDMVESKRSLFPYLWFGFHHLQSQGELQNDGMVPAKSALWGTALGELEGDHIAETMPALYGGKFIYDDVFELVLNNLVKLRTN